MVPAAVAQTPALRVHDVLAGDPIVLETLPMNSGVGVSFTVQKPNGLSVNVSSVTDKYGIARASLDGNHSKRAGFYEAMVSTSAGMDGKKMTFEVHAQDPSPTRSLVTTEKTSVQADGKDATEIQVTLKDQYGNIVPETMVTLLASRNGVVSQKVSNVTDLRGEASFRVRSSQFGSVLYSVLISSTETLLNDTVRISYYNEGQSLASIGSTNLLAQPTADSLLGDSSTSTTTTTTTNPDSGTLYPAFEASAQYTMKLTVPPTATVNAGVDVTVEVFDKNGNPATDYRGTVIFESNDTRATLPLAEEGYTFEAEDLGTQTFFKALSFRDSGEKIIRVSDVDNPDLFGENSIIVTGTDGGNDPVVGGEIQVLFPSAGQTLSDNSVTVLANGPLNRRMEIFNDGRRVGEIVSDDQGDVRFELTNLTSGKHELEIVAYDADGLEIGRSDSVVFFVDQDAAQVNSVTVDPSSTVQPGDFVTITVESEAGLSEVAVQVGNFQETLDEDPANPGTYRVEYRAPQEPGTYPIRVFLRDQFDNVLNQETDEELIVVEGENSTVENFRGVVSGTRVDLTWDVPEDTDAIKEVIVSYGTAADELDMRMSADVADGALSIDDLEADTMYYFVLRVVDETNSVMQRSDVLSLTTEAVVDGFTDFEIDEKDDALQLFWTYEGQDVDHFVLYYGIDAGSYLEEVEIDGDRSAFELDQLINGTTYYVLLDAMDASGSVIASSEELQATPGGSGANATDIDPRGTICSQQVQNVRLVRQQQAQFLQWDVLSGVDTYHVYKGATPDTITTYVTAVTGQNYFQIPEHQGAKETSYFGIKGYCPDRGEGSANLSNALAVETGPALLLLGVATLLATLYMRRRYN